MLAAQEMEYEDDDAEEEEYDDESDGAIVEGAKEVIKLVNVHKTYLLGLEGVPALRGVNLTINKGEFVTILGTSGGGKTMRLRDPVHPAESFSLCFCPQHWCCYGFYLLQFFVTLNIQVVVESPPLTIFRS